jgi:beta-glucuronidase
MLQKDCKNITLLIAFIISCMAGYSQKTIHNVYGREYTSLNGQWKYIIDPYQMGYLDYRQKPFDQSESGKGGFYDNLTEKDNKPKTEYNFDYEPSLAVPGDWNSQDERLSFYEGTIWYKRDFNAAPDKDKRYFLYFGAVNYECNVYLNGKKLGNHKGGFTPFQFDVTGKLNQGNNFVVVMADNTRKKDEIPTINTDWWNYGGITRDVMLVAAPLSYIEDYKVQLAKNSKNTIEGYIQLKGSTGKQAVTLEIPELKIKQAFTTDDAGYVKFNFPVKKLQYWSPEAPKLYDVTVSSQTDKVADRIGFKTIKTVDKDIFLNGESIFLKGISVHDENPLIEGRLRGEGDMRMILQWAKELGCNYIRLAHYTHDEKMLKLADEIGLLVWAEVPVYWTISWTNDETYKNAENQLTVGIERDKNRACVAIWSVGNETPITPERNAFMGRLADKARSLDNTRLIAAALEVHRNGYTVIVDDAFADKLDLASFNEYGGWYWSEPQELHKYSFDIKFNKPVVISEFGAEAMGGYHGSEDTIWTEEFQEMFYKRQLEMLEKVEGLRGMTPWILADFKSPRRQHSLYQNFWNRKGLISSSGKKKKAFYVLQNYYKNKTVKKSK